MYYILAHENICLVSRNCGTRSSNGQAWKINAISSKLVITLPRGSYEEIVPLSWYV